MFDPKTIPFEILAEWYNDMFNSELNRFLNAEYLQYHIGEDDLRQMCLIALWNAQECYQPEKAGTASHPHGTFPAYLKRAVRNTLITFVRDNTDYEPRKNHRQLFVTIIRVGMREADVPMEDIEIERMLERVDAEAILQRKESQICLQPQSQKSGSVGDTRSSIQAEQH